MHQQDVFRILWKYLRQYKREIVISIVCFCITGGCVAIQPLVIRYIVDDGISNALLSAQDKLKVVGYLCLFYILIAIVRVSVYHIGYRLLLNALESGLKQLQSNVFAHVEHMGLRFHSEVSTGELQNVIYGPPITNIRTYLHSLFSGVPCQMVSLVISLIALLNFDWVMTLVLFATAILMSMINVYSRRKIRRLSSEYVSTEADANQYLVDALNGMDAIKTYAIEDNIQRSLDAKMSTAKDSLVKMTVTNQREGLKVELTQYFGIAVVYMVGTISCIYRNVSVGILYAFLTSMSTILGTLTAWLSLGLQKSSAQSGMDAILKIINKEIDVPNAPLDRAKDIDVLANGAKRGDTIIEFSNVRFAYKDKDVFHDFSCKLKKGESVALVGAGGSGKSTFVKLLLRLYDVPSGEIKVYGNNIKEYNIPSLRSSFGVVPQNTTVFHGTVWDNLKIARPSATQQEIMHAAQLAHMNSFLAELEDGWQTVVGNGGRELSAGQRQRIGIARALLGNPDILIFDEAMSALDSTSEREMQETIKMLMKEHTVIMVTQKISAIQSADRVLVFQNGKITHDGALGDLFCEDENVIRQIVHS